MCGGPFNVIDILADQYFAVMQRDGECLCCGSAGQKREAEVKGKGGMKHDWRQVSNCLLFH